METTEGPLLVLAGPGTGKTRTLTYRAAYIIDKQLASPQCILAVTFTRKAAAEMRERLQRLLGEDIEGLNIGTFHSVCYAILSAERHGEKRLGVYDAPQAYHLLRQAIKEVGLDERRWPAASIADAINRAKGHLRGPDGFVQIPGDYFQERVGRVYTRYQELLTAKEACDFADLIRLTIELLRNDEDTLAHYQELSRYILVDEFQDTSYAQYVLLKLLADRYQNVCCVGSPAQAIYSWRGADIDNILYRFREDFPEAKRVILNRNYRSTQTIVAVGKDIVSPLGYAESQLVTENGVGEPIVMARLPSGYDEALWVAHEARTLHEEEEIPWPEFAVLARTRAQGSTFEHVFMNQGIPYTLAAGGSLLHREEVADLLAYMQLAQDPTNPDALEQAINTPPRGIGPVSLGKIHGDSPTITMEKLTGALESDELRSPAKKGLREFTDFIWGPLWEKGKQLTPAALLDYIVDETGYEAWASKKLDWPQEKKNIQELRRMAAQHNTLEDFLAEIDRLREASAESRFGVLISTVHAAKGLEFEVVFVVGLEEGLFPHAKSLKTAHDPNEERRLFYVAVSRAKSKLYLLQARRRPDGNGNFTVRTPSRFLRDISPQFVMRRKNNG